MSTFERFERSIPELMGELAPARMPDYVDDMLRQTASHGQRPAWSFPERWLPVEITARPLATRSFPWRPLVVLALLALLVVATLIAYTGSQAKLPPPFGVAGNGALFYRGPAGAIVSLDPTTGSTKNVPGADGLGFPLPSRDGRQIALVQFGFTSSEPVNVMSIDGSKRVTLGEFREIDAADWSPDGTQLAIIANDGGQQSVIVLKADGSGARTLPLDRQVSLMSYLPDGRLAVSAADQPADTCGDRCALFVINADGTGLDRLLSADEFHGINTIVPSPDGTKLLWVEWDAGREGRLHLFDLATHRDELVPAQSFPATYAINRAWFSPDGTSILFDLFEPEGDHWAVVPAAGGEIRRLGPEWPGDTPDAAWSPDGRSVLTRYPTGSTTSELWLLDATGSGQDLKLDAEVPDLPAWQRVAP